MKTCSYLSHPPPLFELVSSRTLSRWVRSVLEKCKIDTSIFSGYLTRHTSTSAAKRKGLNISIIKKTAGWTERSKTLAKFYNLPLTQERDKFGKTILQSKSPNQEIFPSTIRPAAMTLNIYVYDHEEEERSIVQLND